MGEGEGGMIWENGIEICIISYMKRRQSRFDARYWMLGAGTLGRPRRMIWGGRREEGSGCGTRVCLWRIHFDIWQNQYNIVKFKNTIKKKEKKRKICPKSYNCNLRKQNFLFFFLRMETQLFE